jgi:hypothetical protein
MRSNKVYLDLKKVIENYSNSLGIYTSTQFYQKENEDVWSLAQMYDHICVSSKKFFLANILRCLDKRNGQEGGDKSASGEWVYVNGGFPNKKVKMPEAFAQVPIQERSPEEYRKELDEILQSAEGLIDKLDNDSGIYKTYHPVFGFLNAIEWFINLEMHCRHHLNQKVELETYGEHKI